MHNENVEIKPCPFCGCDKLILSNNAYICKVICKECGASSPGFAFDGYKAIEAWNRRHKETESEE